MNKDLKVGDLVTLSPWNQSALSTVGLDDRSERIGIVTSFRTGSFFDVGVYWFGVDLFLYNFRGYLTKLKAPNE